MRKHLLLILWMLFSGIVATYAQSPFFQVKPTNGKKIRSIGADHNRTIWLGSNEGVYAFDGITLYPFLIDSNAGAVTSIFQDTHLTHWIGTENGRIFQLDISRQIKPFDIPFLKDSSSIRDITEDLQGRIWVSTYGEGVFVWDFKQWIEINLDHGIGALDIYDLCMGQEGRVWLATDNGISICTLNGTTPIITNIGTKQGLSDQLVTAIAKSTSGIVWAGTHEGGLFKWNSEEGEFEHVSNSQQLNEISSICIEDENSIWISTTRKGLWRYNPSTDLLQQIETNLEGSVETMFLDKSGNLWLVLSNGELISAYAAFETRSLTFSGIQSLLVDAENRIWMGTESGLYMVSDFEKKEEIQRLNFSTNLTITDLIEDDFNNVWISTLNEGLYVWNEDTKKLKKFPSLRGRGGESIMSLAATSDKVWLASLEGIFSFPRHKNILSEEAVQFIHFSHSAGSSLHYVFDMYADSKGKLWLATDGHGVYSLFNDVLTQYSGNDSLIFNTVYSITEHPDGIIWLNVPGQGLLSYNDGRFNRWTGELGNFTSINSIASSKEGPLVIVHGGGIDLLDTETKHLFDFSADIGVNSIESGINAIATAKDGTVYIGGTGQLIRYKRTVPGKIQLPMTFISDVKLFNVSIPFRSKSVFSYDENFIAFDYTGIWYPSPEDIRYEYMLEGYDLTWKKSTDREASYSHLDPGDYTFKVRSAEFGDFQFAKETSYSFTIKQPFWLHPLFFILIGLIVFLILYFLIRQRENQSRKKILIERERVSAQLEALKAQINPHFLFNSFNTLINLIDENASKPAVAIEYVEKLSDFFRHILQYREQDKIPLREEWQIVQDYIFLLKKRYGDNLKLQLDPVPKEGFIMPLTLQILLENAVKHNVITKVKPLEVIIEVREGNIVVSNNMQKKTQAEPSTRFGLQSLKTRYSLSGHEIVVSDDNNVFQVKIPILS